MILHANCYFPLIANYFILSRRSARESWKKKFPINQNALFPEILHSRILFLLIQLGSKALSQSAVQIKSEIKRHYHEQPNNETRHAIKFLHFMNFRII